MKTKILIVDDHSFTRAGIRAIIETSKDIEIVGEAVDGNDAILKVKEKQPDIVIMDINMPNLSGIEATKKILSVNSAIKVMALSMHSGEHFVKEMLNAGAVGYLLKDDVPEELVKAIEKIIRGEMILSSAVTRAALTKGDRSMDINILQTKLHRTPIQNKYISRQRIIDKLENNVIQPLSIISAGAGFGKSTAVSDWLEKTSYLNTWISLDKEHNEFRTLLFYLIAAIEKIFPGAMTSTGDMLKLGDLPPFKSVFTSFINEICNIDQDFIMVLDDFHLLREAKIHQFFDEWLRFPPPNVHLSIITRRDIPLDLSSLRNSGQMIEIRMKDLSFSNEEIAELFNNLLGIELSYQTIEKLQEQTDGWIIGLKLTSMAIEEEEDIDKIIQTLDLGMNSVTDYLMSEVMSKQPESMIQRLIESSVLNRFCSELIEDITMDNNKLKEGDAGKIDLIQWLIKSNMFLTSLDAEQKWFRYHHLFQQLLQNQLIRRKTTEQIHEIHKLASQWFEKNNFIHEAIEHCLKAQDPDCAIAIIEKYWEETFDKDLWYQVEGWLDMIPEEILLQSVSLLLARLWILQKRHRVSEIPALIDLINNIKAKRTDKEEGYMAFAKCMNHLFTGDFQKALDYAEKALQLIPKTHYIFRADTYGWWTVAMQVNGRGDEAVRSAKEALKNMDPPGEPIQTVRRMMHPNFVYMVNADLILVEKNIETFFTLPDISPYILAFGWYFKASTSWWSNDLKGAISGFEKVITYKYQCRPRIVIEAYICMAIALQQLNRYTEANRAMNSGVQFAEGTKDPVNINIITSGQIRLKLLQGELGTAEKWLRTTKHEKLGVSMLWWIEVSAITQCRVLIAINTAESLGKAEELLINHKEYSESIFNKLRVIEIVVLQARVALKLKREKDAKAALKYALELAEEGYAIRPFVEGVADLKELLLLLKKQQIGVGLIDLILANIKNNPDVSIQTKEHLKQIHKLKHSNQYVAFTRKESEILLCVSDGLRNQEIADKLFNSEQTIKKHLSNMFQKLQVRNRLSLVAKAKELGMLE